jgi:hypothetical protein
MFVSVAELLSILGGKCVRPGLSGGYVYTGQEAILSKLFYSLNLEKLVLQDHILSRLDSSIYLDFLYGETELY